MANTEPPLAIFVLAGQSNMAGRGGVQRMPDGSKVWDGHTPQMPVRKSSPFLLIMFNCSRYLVNVANLSPSWLFRPTHGSDECSSTHARSKHGVPQANGVQQWSPSMQILMLGMNEGHQQHMLQHACIMSGPCCNDTNLVD